MHEETMRIDDKNTAGAAGAELGRAQAAEQAERQEALRARVGQKAGGGRDEVALSALSAKLAEMQPGSAEREARIEALAARFEAGRYEPDGGAVAGRLIDEAEMKGDAGSGR